MIEDLKEFLRTKILSTNYIYFDLWSIVHFFSGFCLGIFRFNPILALIIIVGFEIIEPFIIGFKAETLIDKIWDVIFGMMGYFIAILMFGKRQRGLKWKG